MKWKNWKKYQILLKWSIWPFEQHHQRRTHIPSRCENIPGLAPGLISWEPPLIDNSETPSPWKPPQRRREGWLEGCCEWGDVTAPAPESLLQKTERERERREEGKEKQGREKGRERERLLLLEELEEVEVRSALHRRALAPIHHLSVRHQSGASCEMYTAVGARGRRGENGKILLHQMWTQTAGAPDYIRNA